MALRRRTFFGSAAAAGAAALAASSASAGAPAPSVVRTAVCAIVQCHSFEPTDFGVFEWPEGFVPVAVACDDADVTIRLHDDLGDVIIMHAFAFRYGPIDLWRPVVGKLKLEVEPNDCLSVFPRAVVTLYGQIDID